MALLLRKTCEPLMQAADIDICYADIQEHSKCLTLFTPCGKNLVSISGIKFSRLNPTKAEIDYAAELLEGWLITNKELLERYMEAFSVFQGMPNPRSSFHVGTIEIEYRHQTYHNPEGFYVRSNGHKITLNMQLHIVEIEFSKDNPPGAAAEIQLPLNEDVITELEHELVARQDYFLAAEALDEIKAELNSCEV